MWSNKIWFSRLHMQKSWTNSPGSLVIRCDQNLPLVRRDLIDNPDWSKVLQVFSKRICWDFYRKLDKYNIYKTQLQRLNLEFYRKEKIGQEDIKLTSTKTREIWALLRDFWVRLFCTRAKPICVLFLRVSRSDKPICICMREVVVLTVKEFALVVDKVRERFFVNS